jgi:hypothetical protein
MATVGATLAPSARQAVYAAKWRREHLFFTILPIAMFATVFVGFSQTYYLKPVFGTPPLGWLYHVHGAAFTTWLLLMMAQPAQVLARRIPLHRQLGWIAAALVPAMAILGWLVSVDLGRRGGGPPGVPPLVFMVVPMATVVVFPAFIAAAIYWRENRDIHKRLMLIGTLELVPAGVARIPGVLPLGPLGFFGLSDLFLLTLVVYDLVIRRRIHAATAIGGALLIGSQFGRFLLASTAAWDSFARWAIS